MQSPCNTGHAVDINCTLRDVLPQSPQLIARQLHGRVLVDVVGHRATLFRKIPACNQAIGVLGIQVQGVYMGYFGGLQRSAPGTHMRNQALVSECVVAGLTQIKIGSFIVNRHRFGEVVDVQCVKQRAIDIHTNGHEIGLLHIGLAAGVAGIGT